MLTTSVVVTRQLDRVARLLAGPPAGGHAGQQAENNMP